MLYVALAAHVLMASTYIWRLPKIPPQLPLFYSLQSGESQLGEWWMLFILPILMDIFLLINFIILKKYFTQSKFAHKLIVYFTSFVMISFTFIFIKILLMVT